MYLIYRSKTIIVLLILSLLVGVVFIQSACKSSTKDKTETKKDEIQTKRKIVPVVTHTLFSPVYTIDKEYKSMKGPYSVQNIYLENSDDVQLLWIVGMASEIVNEDGQKVLSDEYMCHANIDIDSPSQRFMFRNQKRGSYNRLVTLSQGQTDVKLPEGYGIPVLSSTPLQLTTQVLNLNEKEKLPIKVRQRVTVKYIRNKDLEEPLIPLYRQDGAYVMVSMEGQPAVFDLNEPLPEHQGASCLPGQNAGTDIYEDRLGRLFSGHWVVKPGRIENHTVVTEKMNLPYDTEIHAIGVHLHPFAEYIALKDLTTNEVLYENRPVQAEGRIGLAQVPYYSDGDKGIPLHKDHEYEIISTYNNTSSEDQDAMAVLGLYSIDKDFNPLPDLLKNAK